jgi:hypothetical protein
MEYPSVTTARAAEIVGIGYEGLRSQLKRGLLKNVGTLVPFYGPDTEAEVLYAKRWRWSKFGVPDLCLMRVAKVLMDAGCSFDVANDIASTEDLWRWFSRAEAGDGLFLTVLPDQNSYCLYEAADYHLIVEDHVGYDQGVILVSLSAIHQEVSAAAIQPEQAEKSDAVDRAVIEALYALLAQEEGIEVADLLTRLDDLFERPRDKAMSDLLAERRPPWKVLVDEVLPIAAFLRARGETSGRIRFPQDDTAYDAWIESVHGDWRGIEVTGALSRAQIALAGAQRDEKIKAGFLGLADTADSKTYAAALNRPRVMHSRRGVEMQVEAGLRAALAKKNKPGKYSAGTLLIAIPLMRLQDDNWDQVAESLRESAEALPFNEIYAIDDRKEPPRILRLK